MKPFHFQQFSIQQSKEVFRVGTDGVLLGALVECEDVEKVLEVGTGTGLISLMIAQRNAKAKILALDINERAILLAKENFEKSPFFKRLKVIKQDFKSFLIEEKFDLIVCNPPYFERIEDSQKDVLARQQVELTFEQLIEQVVRFLDRKGRFSVIIPRNSVDFFIEKCRNFGLIIQKRINIRGNIQNEIKRVVLEFCFHSSKYIEKEMVLEKSPRVYSDEYLEITKDFHLFK